MGADPPVDLHEVVDDGATFPSVTLSPQPACPRVGPTHLPDVFPEGVVDVRGDIVFVDVIPAEVYKVVVVVIPRMCCKQSLMRRYGRRSTVILRCFTSHCNTWINSIVMLGSTAL